MKSLIVKALLSLTPFLVVGTSWAEDLNTDIKVVIEEPAEDERYSGIMNLRGWAVAPEGMGTYFLNVYVDGEFAFYMPHGGERVDVASAYPNHPNSNRSGFSMAFNYKNLTPGEHSIDVVGFDDNGDYNSASVTFTAERFVSEFIDSPFKVNLNTSADVSVLDQHTILVMGASLENQKWDFKLKWDQASQSFKTEGITKSSGGISGGTPPPTNAEVYACVTSPDGYYSSSSNVVRMKNGLETNNFAGDSWSSSDEHVVFETLSGRWYTIKNDEEMFQLDVLAEPTSCFDYNYGLVREVKAKSSGNKALVFSGGEITVSSSCPIGLDSKVGAYGTSDIIYGDRLYIVDLLYAQTCKVESYEEY